MQQGPQRRQIFSALRICDQPMVPDAVKAAGQHVQQEATHELQNKLLGIIPYGDKPKAYFRHFQSASQQIQAVMRQICTARASN